MTEVKHSERVHALLSASGAERWMSCPPSAKLEDQFPNESTVYSKEGTRAHEIAEMCLRAFQKGQSEPIFTGEDAEIRNELSSFIDGVIETYNAEKAIHADAELFLEVRVDLSEYVPESFGTADVVIISGNRMYVIDLKFGKGVQVNAVGNPQLKLYALGALNAFDDLYDFAHVMMEIRQPRKGHYDCSFLPKEELMAWGRDIVIPAAALAYEGKGEFTAGDHCRFCKVKNCKYRADQNMALVECFPDTNLLSNKEVADILPQLNQIETWIKTIKAFASTQLLEGNEVPGWKLVEGKTNRTYINEDQVVAALKAEDYNEALIYEKKLLGITAMEKALGKKIFAEILGDLVTKPPGAPTLAPENDKRKEYSTAAADFAAIE